MKPTAGARHLAWGALCGLLLLLSHTAAAAQPSAPLQRDLASSQRPATSSRVQVLRRVVLDGSSLPAGAFDEALAPFQGKRLDKARLRDLMQATAQVYKAHDVAFYTVKAPAQTFDQGVVRLKITEGYISEVEIRGAGKRSKAGEQLAMQAERIAQERPLRRSTLDHYMALMREVPGVELETQLERKEGEGLVLGVGVKPRPNEISLTLRNRGSTSLGEVQAQLSYTGYSLARGGDVTQVVVSVPTDVERFQYLGVSHSTPVGADGVRLQANVASLHTRPKGAVSGGSALIAGVQVSVPVTRRPSQHVTVVGTIDGVDSRNATFGAVRSNERTIAVRAAAKGARFTKVSSLHGDLSLTAGNTRARYGARASDRSFQKVKLAGSYARALPKRRVVRLTGLGQLASTKLPASELMSLGGERFGRAFAQSTVLGDSGAAASIELASRELPVRTAGKDSEIYVFADAGQVWSRGRYGNPGKAEVLASAGAGVRLSLPRNVVLGLEGAIALASPRSVSTAEHRVGFSLRAST